MTLPFRVGPDPRRPPRGFQLWERLSAAAVPPEPEPFTPGQAKIASELFPEAAARAKLPLSARIGHLLTPPTLGRDAASTTLDAPPPYVPQVPGVQAAPERSLRELQPVAPREGPEAIRAVAHAMDAGLGHLPVKIVGALAGRLLSDDERRSIDADAGYLRQQHPMSMGLLELATNLKGFQSAERMAAPVLRRGASAVRAADAATNGGLTMLGATGAAGAGGLTGAALDDEHPLRGGLLGAVAGASTVLGGRALLGGVPRAAEVGTMAAGDRALLSSIPLADADVQRMLAAVPRRGLGERGVIGIEQVPRAHGNVRLPEDEQFAAAVRNTPGAEITPNGLRIALERFQKSAHHGSQAGEESVRSGVMYLPAGDPARKYYRPKRGTAESQHTYGGLEHVTGETVIQRPLVVRGGTGGKVPERALAQLLGKERAKQLDDDIYRIIQIGGYTSAATRAGQLPAVRELLSKYGADPSMAESIVQNSQKGNQLRYALAENIAAHAARAAGHDAIVGFSSGRARGTFLSEVFDVRESHYPVPGEPGTLHPEFERRYKALRAPAPIAPPAAEVATLREAAPGSAIAEGLTKDEAIGRMRGLPADVRAEMRRQPDGTFSIVRRGAPQAQAVAPTKPAKPLTRVERLSAALGLAEESGFQSRLLTALDQKYKDHPPAPAAEWMAELARDPDVPQDELRAIHGGDDPLSINPKDDFWLKSSQEDPRAPVTHAQVREYLAHLSPATELQVDVHTSEGGGISDEAVENEAQFLAEQEELSRQEDVDYSISRVRKNRDRVLQQLEPLLGTDASAAWIQRINDALYTDEAGIVEAARQGDLPESPEERYSLADFEGLLGQLHTPEQLPLSPEMRPELSADELGMVRSSLESAFRHSENAEDAARNRANYEPDWDTLRDEARRTLEEQGFSDGDAGDTQYATYQRVDKDAPYREIVIKLPGSPARSSHFTGKVAAHARAEVHGDTFLMIEAQSDAAKELRRGGPSEHVKNSYPFIATNRWAQLSVGASLQQAAKEGSEYFAWVSPADRVSKASLNPESAEITYGKAVPGAVERIFQQLGQPYTPENWSRGSHVYKRVRLTPALRQLILKAGVPALGLGGMAVSVSGNNGKAPAH